MILKVYKISSHLLTVPCIFGGTQLGYVISSLANEASFTWSHPRNPQWMLTSRLLCICGLLIRLLSSILANSGSFVLDTFTAGGTSLSLSICFIHVSSYVSHRSCIKKRIDGVFFNDHFLARYFITDNIQLACTCTAAQSQIGRE